MRGTGDLIREIVEALSPVPRTLGSSLTLTEQVMAKRNVQFVSGAYYHIYNRGAHRASIFREDRDYLYVLRAMKRYSQFFGLTLIAYCLMPNHYHWLVRQNGEGPARLLPQRVFNGYTKMFNNQYHHSGTLFEGEFKAVLVDRDEYLRHLCCYIHGNPVKDGFALTPELWPYSNYVDWIGQRNGSLVDHDFVRAHFRDASAYQQTVLDYLVGRTNLSAGLQQIWA